ncbi:MAG: hypothetical protein U1F52_08025 [Burkholderiales bacterium]
MKGFFRAALLAIAWAIATTAGVTARADDKADDARNKADAVSRVAKAHDETMITGAARLITKQLSLRLARNLLADWGKTAGLGPDWKEDVAEWEAAEALLIRETADQPLAVLAQDTWVKGIRETYVSANFAGEEADTIATHFASESGKAQIALMDWFMGEMTLFNYTYTGRFKYDLKGAEAELKALQKAAQSRLPEKDNELQFSTKHREAFQFVACSPESRYCPGVKYSKMIAIPLQGAIIRHIDEVGAQIQAAMVARRDDVQPYLDAFRNRR